MIRLRHYPDGTLRACDGVRVLIFRPGGRTDERVGNSPGRPKRWVLDAEAPTPPPDGVASSDFRKRLREHVPEPAPGGTLPLDDHDPVR